MSESLIKLDDGKWASSLQKRLNNNNMLILNIVVELHKNVFLLHLKVKTII